MRHLQPPSYTLARPIWLALILAILTITSAVPLHAAEETVTISGKSWLDLNRNGTRDEGEPLLAGIQILGGNAEHSTRPFWSRTDGTFELTGLRPGTYSLQAILRDEQGAPGGRNVLLSPARTVNATTTQRDIDLGLLLPITPRDERYFSQTGYRVDNDHIWEYFRARGGVTTFGYPVSRAFLLDGVWTQIFQRHVISVIGTTARPMNLLDPGLLPATRVNGSTFPAYDAGLASRAPGHLTPDYGNAVRSHLEQHVPQQWDGKPVRFLESYLAAAPGISGPMQTLIALEVWGFPTSAPMRDPNNHNFIYQRFQRGILHFDGTAGVTRGILLGDGFKSVITGQNLPTDLATDMITSPFLRVYDSDAVNGLAPVAGTIPSAANSNFAFAFIQE